MRASPALWLYTRCIGLISLLAGASIGFAEPVQIAQVSTSSPVLKPRLATSIPNRPSDLSSAWAIEEFRSRLKERSQGRIDLQVFWGGQLYSEVAAVKAMLDGAVEFGTATSANTATFTRAYFVLDMPYLFPSADVLGKTLILGPFNKTLKEMVSKDQPNMMPLIIMRNEGLRDLQCSKKVLVPADLRGLKVRTPETPVDLAIWRDLGAIATPISWAETYTAGTQNLIQCLAVSTGYWVIAGKAHEWTGHITRVGYQAQLHVINVSSKFLSSLPADQQKLVLQVAKEVESEAVGVDDKYAEKWVNWLKTEGKQTIYVLNDAQRKEWVEKSAPVYSKFKDKIPPGLVDELRSHMKTIQ